MCGGYYLFVEGVLGLCMHSIGGDVARGAAVGGDAVGGLVAGAGAITVGGDMTGNGVKDVVMPSLDTSHLLIPPLSAT